MLGGHQRTLKGSAHEPKETPARRRLSHAGRMLRLVPRTAGLWRVLTWGCSPDATRGTNARKPPSRGKGDVRDSRWKVPSLLHGKLRQPVKSKSLSRPTLCDPMDYTFHGILRGQNTGVGSLSLLRGIFPTQGLSPGLPHCRRILSQLSYQASPRILEWVAYLFSGRSSRPRNRTGVYRIAGGFFTNWATREARRWGKCWEGSRAPPAAFRGSEAAGPTRLTLRFLGSGPPPSLSPDVLSHTRG